MNESQYYEWDNKQWCVDCCREKRNDRAKFGDVANHGMTVGDSMLATGGLAECDRCGGQAHSFKRLDSRTLCTHCVGEVIE